VSSRWAIAALALLGAACNAEVEVLRPGAAPSNAAAGGGGGGPTGAGGDGTIGSLPACLSADGTSCLRQAGEPCDDAHPCCTGWCEAQAGGAHCAYLGGCHQQCETCSADFECCSGRCEQDTSGALRCAASKPWCLAEGELCTKENDCCPGGPGTHCSHVGGPDGEMRCRTPSGESQHEGEICALPTDCDSGICVPGDDDLVCAGGCRPEGASCSATGDCCEPGSHACLPVGGAPSCVASN
jgi:hypothetical protein